MEFNNKNNKEKKKQLSPKCNIQTHYKVNNTHKDEENGITRQHDRDKFSPANVKEEIILNDKKKFKIISRSYFLLDPVLLGECF